VGLADGQVKRLVADGLGHEPETAVQSFVANKLGFLAVDDVDHGLAEGLCVLGVKLAVEAVLRQAAGARLGIARPNI
jgi:hypothetical protein